MTAKSTFLREAKERKTYENNPDIDGVDKHGPNSFCSGPDDISERFADADFSGWGVDARARHTGIHLRNLFG